MTAALDATLVSTLWPARPSARLARDAALVGAAWGAVEKLRNA